MDKFKFEIGQDVRLKMSEEKGTVIGRAEYANDENRYEIVYRNVTGAHAHGWFTESELV
jgi:heat shock protein HspQ